MGRSNGASFEIVTGNLVEEFNSVPFEFFNGVNLQGCKMGRSNGASLEIVTGNLVEEFNSVPFEFFNGVNAITTLIIKN
jgi:hypothetical protein